MVREIRGLLFGQESQFSKVVVDALGDSWTWTWNLGLIFIYIEYVHHYENTAVAM